MAGMKTLVSIFRRARTSGGWASAASAGAMAAAGVRDCQSTFAPINAVSHWIWADPALRKDRPSLRYTATGYAIHHLASDRKSTRLNSSHVRISYAVFCLKKKKKR